MPVLRAFRDRVDPRRYNGASLLGLRGIVIKSHGSADVFAFGQALRARGRGGAQRRAAAHRGAHGAAAASRQRRVQ